MNRRSITSKVVRDLFEQFGLDPKQQTPARQVAHHLGESLVRAMEMAQQGGTPEAAELVACECVVLAETKDHQNWELLSKCAEKAKGDEKKALIAACEEVEDEEDEHLYHSKGWCRELWIQSLGMPAVLPPPLLEDRIVDLVAESLFWAISMYRTGASWFRFAQRSLSNVLAFVPLNTVPILSCLRKKLRKSFAVILSAETPLAPRSPETPKHPETWHLGPMKGPKSPRFQATRMFDSSRAQQYCAGV